jgi:CotH kinase protein
VGWRSIGILGLAVAACGDPAGATDGDTGSHDPPPRVVLNEVRCGAEDFVEIVNVGDAVVDLSAVFVTDDQDGPKRAEFTVDELAPGGFAAATLTSFGLGCADEHALLMFGDEAIGDVLAPRPAADADAWGRIPDGSGEWLATSPTPGAANQPATPAVTLFDLSVIHDIAVELDDASFAAIEAESVTPVVCVPFDRSYHPGTVTIDGERFDGVGVRSRGNGTADSLYGKPSLKLNFGWDDPVVEGCPEERTAFGQRKLNLINMRQDPSFVRIPLAGELYAALDVPQPRTSYARLTINGEYTGIVVLGENIDRQFLGEWFESNDGMMYEAGCHCEIGSGNVPAQDGDPSCFSQDFSVGPCDSPAPEQDPIDWTMLAEFAAALEALPPGSFYPEIEAFFDFDGFLSLWAATMFLGSGDGYFLNQNSYRIYHDPSTDRFAMIDHGSADGIMRTFADTCDQNAVLQLGPAPDLFGSSGTLPTRCLADPDCTQAFAQRVWEVHDAFLEFGLRARAEALHGFIIDEMREDPRYYYNGCGVPYAWADIEGHLTDYVLPWIDRRFDEVAAQLTAAGYPQAP